MKKLCVNTTFKFNIRYMILFFFMVLLTTSCQKENINNDIDNNDPEIQIRGQDKGGVTHDPIRVLDVLPPYRPGVIYLDGSNVFKDIETRDDVDCESVGYDDTYFRIRYCVALPGGGFDATDRFCFTEEGLAESLADAGLSQSEIDQILQDLFHSDTAPSPELVHTIGGLLAGDLDLPPNVIEDCYQANVWVNGDFSDPNNEDCEDQIDLYYITQSQAAGGVILVNPASNDVTVENTCEGTTLDLNLTVDIMRDALVASGMTVEEANQKVTDIALGLLSPREFLELFQNSIVPNHPDFPNVSDEELFCCYRITRVIVSLLAGGSVANSIYRVDGSASIGCETNPYAGVECYCECWEEDYDEIGVYDLVEMELDCCEQRTCEEIYGGDPLFNCTKKTR